MNGNTERAQCALSRVCIPKKRKRKAVKRIKQIYKISQSLVKLMYYQNSVSDSLQNEMTDILSFL